MSGNAGGMATGRRAPGRPRPPGRGEANSPGRGEARSAARTEALGALSWPLRYPEELPVTGRRDELVAAIAAHQVVVVAGETGSGKSTQLPKICLEAGRGVAGMIGHTQPRRIAARSVAERVADELGAELGGPVGYKVRFTDRVGDGTLIKVMTDGVLLAELAGDRSLSAYDTLIIDEAHERSLNIDFLLGYLALLLPKRPELKVVVTSATIDTESFSRHFAHHVGSAPVIEVAGRTYPVEIRYRPFGSDEAEQDPGQGGAVAVGDADEVQAVCNAVAELSREGPGDILVFLAGEAEIRDTAEALSKSSPTATEVVPLYGRLSSGEQHRVFAPHAGRRVVLATNVAETSITVPGVRYVVDAGTARISRYGRRTKVQRLPIERISRASADQRAGRCGRLGPGICVRLYSEADYLARQHFTEPEVLRTNLASVLLQMAAIGLGDIERFPFVDAPERRNVKDGLAVLEELGALRRDGAAPTGQPTGQSVGWELTSTGRKLARLPLDPRLGRMVLEGARLGCLAEVLVIVAGLAVQDPRERPAEKRAAADALHRRFDDPGSDFLSYLALWDYLGGRRGEMSGAQFRRLCQKELVSYQRAREWQDVHAEIVGICREIRLFRGNLEQPAPLLPQKRKVLLHQALLSGLVSHVGKREGERADFSGPRGARFALWPTSVLAKKAPRWVMAAELVETRRLWARVAAPVKPEWVERAGAHLLEWSYGEPFWEPERAEAALVARATLYGLPVVVGRRVALARLGSEQARRAREIFVHEALVEGDWDRAPEFVTRNSKLLDGLLAAANRARRPGLAPGKGELYDFYDARVPGTVVSGRTFEDWWASLGPEPRRSLEATPEQLGTAPGEHGGAEAFPDEWPRGDGQGLPIDYDWDALGVTIEVPLARLGELREELEWQVPGLRLELVEALLRSLPKDLRRELAPIGEKASEFVAKHGPAEGPLTVVLARSITQTSGLALRPEDFDWGRVAPYLRPVVRVVGADGEVLAAGKAPSELAAQLSPQFSRALAEAATKARLGWGPLGKRASTWEFGSLPRVFEVEWQGQRLRGFPALVDEGEDVRVALFADQASQASAMLGGARRLVLLNLPGRGSLVTMFERLVDKQTRLAMAALRGLGYRSPRELGEDLVAAAVDQVVAESGGPPWDGQSFDELVAVARRDVDRLARPGLATSTRVILQLQRLQRRIDQLGENAQQLAFSLADASSHLAALGAGRFVSRAGLSHLADLERYIAALDRRLEKLPADPARDAALAAKMQILERQFASTLTEADSNGRREGLERLRPMLEELRVSFFAQAFGTKFPVSEARFLRALAEQRQAAGLM